jgi:hypothetical protein
MVEVELGRRAPPNADAMAVVTIVRSAAFAAREGAGLRCGSTFAGVRGGARSRRRDSEGPAEREGK